MVVFSKAVEGQSFSDAESLSLSGEMTSINEHPQGVSLQPDPNHCAKNPGD
jgi:hypothetical protein